MTERLYYTDAYSQEFSSTVSKKLSWKGRPAVSLESTCFYPESGGQPADQGHLNGQTVLTVVEQGDEILHVLRHDRLNEKDQVEGKINWVRRFDHMQQHTGQHILSQAFLRELKADTESFHLGMKVSTIDLSLESLSKEELYRAEDSANQIIFQNRGIRFHFVDPSDLQDLPLRGRPERQGVIRVIEVDDFDVSACGGTHCSRTGEVGLIKILRWERVRQKARVQFVCGSRALEDYRWKNRAVYRLSREFSVAGTEVVEAVQKQVERERELRRQIRALESDLLTVEVSQLMKDCFTRGHTRIAVKICQNRDLKALNRAASMILESGDAWIVLLGSRSPKPALLFARSESLEGPDMRECVSHAAPLIDGKGGGTASRAQAGGTRSEGIDDAISAALDLVRNSQEAP